jgi:SHS2 domain-containing protein
MTQDEMIENAAQALIDARHRINEAEASAYWERLLQEADALTKLGKAWTVLVLAQVSGVTAPYPTDEVSGG